MYINVYIFMYDDCIHTFSPFLALYPISASHRMSDMIVMITETATNTRYHLFTVAVILASV